jgi:hypothetical protein
MPQDLVVKSPYELVGTISDPSLIWYGIEIAPKGSGNYFVMDEGSECVDTNVIGIIDPTRIENGLYDLRITAYDAGGHSTVYTISTPVELTGRLKIGQFSFAFEDISIPAT